LSFRRELEDVVETIQSAKERGKGCALLIGAGVSVTAGIPTAPGLVQEIKRRYNRAYQRAPEKTYPSCMAQLLVSERRDLLAGYVDNAKINWAHVAIAQLIQAGYVDRVLTTNFDPLVVRACALIDEFPAVYDVATSKLFKPRDIPDKAIYYLHGQRTGFVLIHTQEDFERHSEFIDPVFEEAGYGRLWIVVGYSGQNDPVFERLAELPRFDNGLYWVGYKDAEPAPHLRERLLLAGKDAFYVSGFDADSFLVSLAQQLEIFPPGFVARPFTHLLNMLDELTPFTLPGETSQEDATATTRRWIEGAIERYEESSAEGAPPSDLRASLLASARSLLMAGDYQQVIRIHGQLARDVPPEDLDTFAWAHVLQGTESLVRARQARSSEADVLFQQACSSYEAALAIQPGMHDALSNWGVALADQAKTKSGAEADALFAQACAKYKAALAIKPDDHEALNNWGNALYWQARTKRGAEADALLEQARAKYEAVLVIKPDMPEALSNWAVALSEQAKTRRGAEADAIFEQAYAKFEAALAIKPDTWETLNSWAAALLEHGHQKTGDERRRLFAQARERLFKVEEIRPGAGAYNLACLAALEGNEAECRRWLNACAEHGTLPSRKHLTEDSDLESVRDKEWFQTLLPEE